MSVFAGGRKVTEIDVTVTAPLAYFDSPPAQHFALPVQAVEPREALAADTTSDPGYPALVSSPKPSGRNIPEAQRGDERIVIRSPRGTKDRLAELMAKGRYAKLGDLLLAALDALEATLPKTKK
jgi:hypothetical protein